MRRNVILVHPSLHFISIGTDTIHALDVRFPGVMCGKEIPPGNKPQAARQFSDDQLCGGCLKSLRTYMRDYVRFENIEGKISQ